MEIDIPVFNPVKEKCQLRKLEKFNIVLRPELAKSILTQDLDFSVELPSGLTLYSEGRESRSRLGLETKGTETLGLVSVSY